MWAAREWMVSRLGNRPCLRANTTDTFMPSVKGEALDLNWRHSKRTQHFFDLDSTKAWTICYYYIIISLLWQLYSKATIIGLKSHLELCWYHQSQSQGHSDHDCSCTSRSTIQGVCAVVYGSLCVCVCVWESVHVTNTHGHTHTSCIINGPRSFLQWYSPSENKPEPSC